MKNGLLGQFGPLSSGQVHRVEGNGFSGILTFGTSWRTRNGNLFSITFHAETGNRFPLFDGLFSAMTRPRGPFCQVEWTTLHIGRRIGGIIPGKTAPQREFRPLQGEDAAQKKRFAQKTKKIRAGRKKRLSMLIRWRAKELGHLVSHSRTENGTVLEMVH
jgi:hypothetical protein